MIEQIENILSELKAITVKLPELRDLFWLKIDRYDETDLQRGVAFDEKIEQQCDKLIRAIDSFTSFAEKSFTPSTEEIAKGKALEKLRAEFQGFDNWNREAKKALLEREIQTFPVKIPQRVVKTNSEKPNHGPKYQINDQPAKL